MGDKLQGAAERKMIRKLPRAPDLGKERGGSGGDRTGRRGNSNEKLKKKSRRQEQMKYG